MISIKRMILSWCSKRIMVIVISMLIMLNQIKIYVDLKVFQHQSSASASAIWGWWRWFWLLFPLGRCGQRLARRPICISSPHFPYTFTALAFRSLTFMRFKCFFLIIRGEKSLLIGVPGFPSFLAMKKPEPDCFAAIHGNQKESLVYESFFFGVISTVGVLSIPTQSQSTYSSMVQHLSQTVLFQMTFSHSHWLQFL